MTCLKNRKMDTSVFVLVFFLFVEYVHSDINEKEASLRFYSNSFENYKELSLSDSPKIISQSWYNASQPTIIFCHGYTGTVTGPAVQSVIKSYLEKGETNVALLNWQYLASQALPNFAASYLNWATPNARQLGANFSDTLIAMSSAGLKLKNLRLIGHSLGAHVFGVCGYNMLQKGIRLPWITGLDPASIGFEGQRVSMRISAESADFVDIIHSDPSKYGFKTSAGAIDYWPNHKLIAVIQPGCTVSTAAVFSMDDLCSHHRSWQLLLDSMKYPGTLMASYAPNYKIWKKSSKADRRAKTVELGVYNKIARHGNYFLITKGESPYGLGMGGV